MMPIYAFGQSLQRSNLTNTCPSFEDPRVGGRQHAKRAFSTLTATTTSLFTHSLTGPPSSTHSTDHPKVIPSAIRHAEWLAKACVTTPKSLNAYSPLLARCMRR